MIVSNWMKPDPVTVSSDTSVVEAQRLISEHNLRILPVVDEGRLRGVLTRKNVNEAANCVARTQNIYEVNYFVDRLKVKDLMNRMLKTVEDNVTVEQVMLRGNRESVSTFPVMKEDRVVGLVSEVEIFEAMIEILGAEENLHGVTLEPVEIDAGLFSRIATVAEEAGARMEAMFTIRVADTTKKKVVLRFDAEDLNKVIDSLKTAGFKTTEIESNIAACVLNNNNGKVVCPDP